MLASTGPIKVGVIVGSPALRMWDVFALGLIRELPFVTIPAGSVLRRAMHKQPLTIDRLWTGLSRVYARLGGKVRAPSVRNAAAILTDTKWLLAEEQEDAPFLGLLEQLKGEELDVVLQLGCSRPLLELASAAPLGIWFCRHGRENGREHQAFAWEALISGESSIESTLEACTQYELRVLCRSRTSVDKCFPHRTALRVYWKEAQFPARALSLLYNNRLYAAGDRARSRVKNGQVSELEVASLPNNASEQLRPPSKSLISAGIIRWTARIASKSVNRLTRRDTWLLGLRRRETHELTDFQQFRSGGFTVIHPTHKALLADPFLLEQDGRDYIFCEELKYKDRKGVISWMEILNDGTVTTPAVALERPYHLSYPFLIRAEGELYMIPETARNHDIELYRCVRFPDCWELDCNILTGVAAVDTTILSVKGKYWLFTCLKEEVCDTADDLHLYWARSLRGPWQAHPLNPVVSDVRTARGAGAIIETNDGIIRPTQDSSERYGWRINFNRILTLSEFEYKEETVGYVGEQWCELVNGAHTWNCSERFEVIDGRISRPKIPALGIHC